MLEIQKFRNSKLKVLKPTILRYENEYSDRAISCLIVRNIFYTKVNKYAN
jgi:hypothetical protein